MIAKCQMKLEKKKKIESPVCVSFVSLPAQCV